MLSCLSLFTWASFKNFVAGLGAGVAEALVIVAPVETVKTKCIQLNKPFINGLQHIIKTEGMAGIYQCATATAMNQGKCFSSIHLEFDIMMSQFLI